MFGTVNALQIHTDFSRAAPYAVMIGLSFLAGTGGLYLLSVRRGIRKDIAGYLLLLCPLMSAAGGMLHSYLESGCRSWGLSSIGGLLGLYAAVLIMGQIAPKGCRQIMVQNATLMLPLMYALGKTGCLLSGCCRGIAYSGPFCVQYTGERLSTGCVFPVQLAESVVFLGIFLLGMHSFRRHRTDTFPLIFLASAGAKFLLDFLREAHQGKVLTSNQVLCILLLAAGSVWLIRSRMQTAPQRKP